MAQKRNVATIESQISGACNSHQLVVNVVHLLMLCWLDNSYESGRFSLETPVTRRRPPGDVGAYRRFPPFVRPTNLKIP